MVNKIIALALFLVAAIAILLNIRARKETGGLPRPHRTQPNVTQEFLALEQSAAAQDASTWAAEIQALRHGKTITDFWDALRTTKNAYSVLELLRFDQLHLPVTLNAVPLTDSITEYRATEGAKRLLASNDWTGFLAGFRAQGFSLEQSDWRQTAFFPGPNAPPRSVFAVELHVNQTNHNYRVQIACDLEITWSNNDETAPMPSLIEVQRLRILTQNAVPQFTHAFSLELSLAPGLETLDPYLAVQDLNGDDLPEIVLAAQNLVLRRNAKNGYSQGSLLGAPRNPIHVALFGEFNGDDQLDFLSGDPSGLWLYAGVGLGKFDAGRLAWKATEPMLNPFVLTAGDIDADGDLDVYIAQYKLPYVAGQMPYPFYNANDGFPGYLLVNDKTGKFVDTTSSSGLAEKRFRRTYSASFVDLDEDGDLDLAQVSDFCGLDIFLNEGTGRFRDATREIPDPHAFGMAHSIADLDGNGALDLLMLGMTSDTARRLDALGLGRKGFPQFSEYRSKLTVGNRLFQRMAGEFRQTAFGESIRDAGWAWGATSFDADHDGDLDVYVANGHNSRSSAMDYESQFWRHDIYVGDSNENAAKDLFFQSFASKLYGAGWSYGGFYKSKFFLNQNGTNFLETAYLAGVAIEEDCRNLVSADLDLDGDLDLVFTTFEQWPRRRQGVHVFENNNDGAWTAVRLPMKASALGTRAVLTLASGQRQVRTYITGDSYRSQHPSTLHFAFPRTDSPSEVQLFQPGRPPKQLRALLPDKVIILK